MLKRYYSSHVQTINKLPLDGEFCLASDVTALEAERDSLKAELEATEADLENISQDFIDMRAELEATKALLGVRTEALERLRDCDWTITLPDRMDAVRQIAREALALKKEEPNG